MKLILLGGIVGLMLLFVWLFSGGDDTGDGGHQHVSSNWNSKSQPFDKDPLGLYLFNTLVQTHINSSKDVYEVVSWNELDSLIHAGKKEKTFMFVGNIFGLDDHEIDSIMSSVSRGSELFLSYNVVTSNIMRNFFVSREQKVMYEEKFEYSESVNVFTDKLKCKMINVYQNDTIACHWTAFGEIETLGDSKSLSSFMEMDNFIEIKFGKGKVLLHTNPLMFYNYQVKRKSAYKYTEYVLSQLPKNQDVLLLELGRLSDDYGSYAADEQTGMNGEKDDSFLKIIFENPTLLTALLLSILGLILFMIFRSKRIRPVVEYREKKKDMTLAFAETITSIYFSKRNPYGLLQVQRKNFYATMHRHFFVDLARRDKTDDKDLRTLAEKSNKSLEEIIAIVNKLETTEAASITEKEITEMAHKQRSFYREVGIISDTIQERLEDKTKTFRRALLLPVLLVLAGVISIVLGAYYLMVAVGVGITLWPLGIALLTLGSIRLSKPFMVVDPKEMMYYTSLGIKKIYKQEDLVGIEKKELGVVIKFTDNRALIINYWDLSRFDKNEFDRFIAKLHTLEL